MRKKWIVVNNGKMEIHTNRGDEHDCFIAELDPEYPDLSFYVLYQDEDGSYSALISEQAIANYETKKKAGLI